MSCPACPCSGSCRAATVDCEWAASGDPVKRANVAARCDGTPTAAQTAPSVVEAWALLGRIKACPYRSTHPPCGCSGGRCALRGGAIVAHPDCIDCLARYG